MIHKKILIYNWIQFDEKENKGGGVTVYTKSLIEALIHLGNWEVFFLSSGRAYNRRRKDTYIEKTDNCFGEKCNSFQIVNSPVLSPAHLSFPYPEDYLEDRSLKEVVKELLLGIGEMDVIHFQNLEGLSLSVLELKSDFPETKFIYSMHNYYPVCPQVMLWKNDMEDCSEKRCGDQCVLCMPKDVFKDKVIYNQQINYDKEFLGEVEEKYLEERVKIEEHYAALILSGKNVPAYEKKAELAQNFKRFRTKNVLYINSYIDEVLAVSKRVMEIAVYFGIDFKKIKVSYIGSSAADEQKKACVYPYDGKLFHVCYLGYMRTMKGFYFLLDSLEKIPDDLALKISVTIAAKITDNDVRDRITRLRNKYAEVIVYEGYSREQLPFILENVQLGIVPPLWEDNLPQVAIEMKANGVAVLAGDLGGAKELTRSDQFVFEAGNQDDFINKLSDFVMHPEKIEQYWDDCPSLPTMKQHIESLMESYQAVCG